MFAAIVFRGSPFLVGSGKYSVGRCRADVTGPLVSTTGGAAWPSCRLRTIAFGA
ncbi:MAG: hypothetical protein ACHQ2Z_08205 [Elusimicrobiota bacterium]